MLPLADALRLRRDHRLVGVSIGGITEFRSQNQVLGLPLELNMEEVSLAVHKVRSYLRWRTRS